MSKLFLYALAIPKTLAFNFRYFPLGQALRLPVFVSHRVWLKQMSGQVRLGKIRTGVVTLGFGDVGIFDRMVSRTIWQVSGAVEFRGKAKIGHGSKINVQGILTIGDNFRMTAESAIIARHRVEIGDEVLVSWDVLVMDTDFHKIYDQDNLHINPDRPITIGNRVWIGCRSLILKGVRLADGVVVAAGSTVSKSVEVGDAVIGGNSCSPLREGIRWEF